MTIFVDTKNAECGPDPVHRAVVKAGLEYPTTEIVPIGGSLDEMIAQVKELGSEGALVTGVSSRLLLERTARLRPITLNLNKATPGNRQSEKLRMPLLALAPTMSLKKVCIYGDVGGHVDNVSVRMRYCWAIMALEMSRQLQLHPHTPIIGIDSIGEEENKLMPECRELLDLLKLLPAIVVRPAEPKEAWGGEIDIRLFRDGRRGNEALKEAEAAASLFMKLTRRYLEETPLGKVAGLAARPSFAKLKHHLDESRFAGALLAGAAPFTLIKVHGRSDEAMYLGAIRRTQTYVERGVSVKVLEGLKSHLSATHPDWVNKYE